MQNNKDNNDGMHERECYVRKSQAFKVVYG